jgi:hypothetical protein
MKQSQPSELTLLPKLSKLEGLGPPTPIISKADIVLAVMDSLGAILDNLAQNIENLEGDLDGLTPPAQN